MINKRLYPIIFLLVLFFISGFSPQINAYGKNEINKLFQHSNKSSEELYNSTTIFGLPADAEILNTHCVGDWTTCRNALVGNAGWDYLPRGTIGATLNPDGYTIQRIFYYFDTTSIPTDAHIVGASINIYAGTYLNGSTTFHIVQSSANLPFTFADFSRIGSISGGSTTALTPNSWMSINLNSNALNWIIPGSMTKIALIHNMDLYNIAPTTTNDVLVGMSDDSLVRPYLVVHYYQGDGPDIGFQPNSDGYSFSNSQLGVNYGDYTISDMRRMFGDGAVCKMDGQTCNYEQAAMDWNKWFNQSMSGGHCYGMAVTSLRFFNNIDVHPGAYTVYDLGMTSNVNVSWGGQSFPSTTRRNIGFFFVTQFVEPIQSAIAQERDNYTPRDILFQLVDAMVDGAPDPMILLMWNGDSGHVITPYKITNPSPGIFWVWVYDNNYPGDANRYVIIDTDTNVWSYDTGGNGIWSGGTGPNTLYAISTLIHSQPMQCPWCPKQLENGASNHSVVLDGAGHLLITDSKGRKLGFVDNQYTEEIPGGYGLVPILGTQVEHEPIYTLPLTETYNILLDGQTLTQTVSDSVAQFGPGYAVSIEDLTVSPTTQDQISISNDGTQMGYYANQDQEPNLTLDVDSLSTSFGFNIQGADIAANHAITMTADTVSGTLTLNGSQLSNGTYNLLISAVSTTGTQNFFHADIPILATDTHIIDFGDWNGAGMITLEIDHGSDGTIDETVQLKNQMFIFLPIINLQR